jgi:geranylgeranyl diphosphate synthase, type II
MKDSSGLKQLIDQYFTSLKLEHRLPIRLYEPMDYILKLKAKRMRPTLTMLSYHAVSGQPAEEAIDLATAVELFHNFTLMHDDIMDRAPVRRGKQIGRAHV